MSEYVEYELVWLWDKLFRLRKNFLSTGLVLELLVGANEASAQGLQNALYRTSVILNFLTWLDLWAFEDRQFVWRLYGVRLYGKIQYK
jgi:hypothetical protein